MFTGVLHYRYMQPVAAIIPAYNEESTISHVVEVLMRSPLLSEVIVVSDGSTDRTAHLAKVAGAKVLELPENRGKGAALFYGVAHTEAAIVVFFDADLRDVSLDHVERLVLPVQSGAASMMIGLRDRGFPMTWVSKYLPKISGMRALHREIITSIDPDLLAGFMVETMLNSYCRRHKLRIGTIVLPGLFVKRKIEKVGLRAGLIGYLKMSRQVIKAMIVSRIAKL